MSRLNASRKSLVVCGALALIATITLVPPAQSQISPGDINQIINQLDPDDLTAITDSLTDATGDVPGTGTDTDTPTDPGTGDPTTPTTGERVPQVIANQFTTVQGGSLAARRPGLWIQQGIGFRATGEPALSGDVPNEPSFFKETLLLMFEEVIDATNNFFDTIKLGIALDDVTGGGATGLTPIPNAATTGQGTSVPIQ